ncbi:hypothetical protein [Kistimonas asteriae]|uniref:hypothetical protein n=1 Tax=Kistimonas asteriae TaxID=517724 RepID=UPI001BA7FEC7|nr:hypothetical protein [Kistimonas asteriae]
MRVASARERMASGDSQHSGMSHTQEGCFGRCSKRCCKKTELLGVYVSGLETNNKPEESRLCNLYNLPESINERTIQNIATSCLDCIDKSLVDRTESWDCWEYVVKPLGYPATWYSATSNVLRFTQNVAPGAAGVALYLVVSYGPGSLYMIPFSGLCSSIFGFFADVFSRVEDEDGQKHFEVRSQLSKKMDELKKLSKWDVAQWVLALYIGPSSVVLDARNALLGFLKWFALKLKEAVGAIKAGAWGHGIANGTVEAIMPLFNSKSIFAALLGALQKAWCKSGSLPEQRKEIETCIMYLKEILFDLDTLEKRWLSLFITFYETPRIQMDFSNLTTVELEERKQVMEMLVSNPGMRELVVQELGQKGYNVELSGADVNSVISPVSFTNRWWGIGHFALISAFIVLIGDQLSDFLTGANLAEEFIINGTAIPQSVTEWIRANITPDTTQTEAFFYGQSYAFQGMTLSPAEVSILLSIAQIIVMTCWMVNSKNPLKHLVKIIHEFITVLKPWGALAYTSAGMALWSAKEYCGAAYSMKPGYEDSYKLWDMRQQALADNINGTEYLRLPVNPWATTNYFGKPEWAMANLGIILAVYGSKYGGETFKMLKRRLITIARDCGWDPVKTMNKVERFLTRFISARERFMAGTAREPMRQANIIELEDLGDDRLPIGPATSRPSPAVSARSQLNLESPFMEESRPLMLPSDIQVELGLPAGNSRISRVLADTYRDFGEWESISLEEEGAAEGQSEAISRMMASAESLGDSYA